MTINVNKIIIKILVISSVHYWFWDLVNWLGLWVLL